MTTPIILPTGTPCTARILVENVRLHAAANKWRARRPGLVTLR
jgi:hypothetical protein